MLDLLIKIKESWDAGGVFIYPIHVVGVLALSIAIERIYWFYFRYSMNLKSFLQQLRPAVERGDLQAAIQYCDSIKTPPSRLAKTLLLRNLEASLARESHPIEKRTSYLAMLANIATLLGLLGTISGLIASFAAAAKADPVAKAELLASGIAEAMNCTAYGLVVAIFSLMAYAMLQGKTQTLLDDLKEASHETKAMLPLNRGKVA